VDKDATDLELAIDVAVREGSKRVIVIAGHGGRVDQSVANVLIIASRNYAMIEMHAVLDAALVSVVHGGGELTIEGRPGDTVTILPIHGDAEGVRTDGLEYPLVGETLPAGTTRGVSNVLSGTGSIRTRSRRSHMKKFMFAVGLSIAMVASACGSSGGSARSGSVVESVLVGGQLPRFDEGTTVKVQTHDSFAVSQSVLDEFEAATNIKVVLMPSGDAASMTNAAILTAGNPVADVIYGFDENLLGSVLSNDLLVAYRPGRLGDVDPSFVIDGSGRATPIDHGDVCVNFDRKALRTSGVAIPTSFEDLTADRLKNRFVVEDPTTSTPGLAFMLATIAAMGGGDDTSSNAAWLRYWKRLKDNGVKVVDSWETAYYGTFSGGSGKGDRPLVVSYASSPPAEVEDTSLAPDATPTGVITSTCYRQTEFAGILRGASNPRAAAAFIEFMLGRSFQADVPQQMYVYPVVNDTPLPATFEKYTAPVAEPLSIPPVEVARNRDRWIQQWSVLFR
jgi:thiamine transport system substrate-binding protein